MKLRGISFDNTGGSLTFEQFLESEFANTPLGKLLIELLAETTWSEKFNIYSSFGHVEPFLQISHKSFLPSRTLMIHDDGKTDLSVSGIETAIQTHINDSIESTWSCLDILHRVANNLQYTLDKIVVDKAIAAIVSAFPATVGSLQLCHEDRRLYAFTISNDVGERPIFVVRKVGDEFVGGVAKIDRSSVEWYMTEGGIGKKQRYGIFWTELARTFAANDLRISADDLYCETVYVTEKPWEFPQPEPYDVEKVTLHSTQEQGVLVVEFGPDNLPNKAFWIREASEM